MPFNGESGRDFNLRRLAAQGGARESIGAIAADGDRNVALFSGFLPVLRDVETRRGESHVAMGLTGLIAQLETRDFPHRQEQSQHFAGEGLSPRNRLAIRGQTPARDGFALREARRA